MFMQVFQGPVVDAAEVEKALDEWVEHLAPGADGWLGSTAGVTEDGTLIAIARFATPEAARRNSDRMEQGEWWSGMSKLFSGEVAFHDCLEVETARGGGSDEAGFVQVIQGRTTDVDRLAELSAVFEMRFPDVRPDLIGYAVGLHTGGDGAFTQVAYFTDEASARKGETGEPPEEALALLQEEMSLMQNLKYFDLKAPWLASPR